MPANLTQKQRAVLRAVDHLINEHVLPPTEYHVSCVVLARGLWQDKDSRVYLYNSLKKLTDRGLLERHGVRGSYRYSLTTEGREALI
jgi:Fe2+ or Zn2+ uptake regulation protein